MKSISTYLQWIPLDKSWLTRMGTLDILHKNRSIESKLLGYKNISEDLSALITASRAWNTDEVLYVGESATLYRILQFASWKFDLHKKFAKEGSLLERVIENDPQIINLSQKELLKLDSGTTQWATAAVICGDMERWSDVPSKLVETYNAVEEWQQCKISGAEWNVRHDKTIIRQVDFFISTLGGHTVTFLPLCSDDYCFARAFGFITSEKGLEMWPSLVGHETNRIEEMEKSLTQASLEGSVDSLDHRVIQSIAMWGRVNNKKIIFKYKDKVAKSWPYFWEFLDEVEKNGK